MDIIVCSVGWYGIIVSHFLGVLILTTPNALIKKSTFSDHFLGINDTLNVEKNILWLDMDRKILNLVSLRML